MSDRTAASIFKQIFTRLARSTYLDHELVKLTWADTFQYDFCAEDMGCDQQLVTLGLAKRTSSGVVYRTADGKGWSE